VSVLLPTYNATATLPACLRSIQRQTFENWECIIVDDGSTDATAAVVGTFAAADRRFVYHRLSHQGLVATLNAGVALCRGEYIARMDADDVMHRQRLGMQVVVLGDQPHLALVGTHARIFPRSGLQAGWRAYEQWLWTIRGAQDVEREIFVESPLVHPTLMIRRNLLTRYGYRDCGWPEDYDLLLRLVTTGHALGVVPRRLLAWRDSATRLSRAAASCSDEVFALCKAQFLAATFLARSARYILWGYGATGRALRKALVGLGKEPAQVIEMHPGRIGNRIHGAPVIAPDQLHGPSDIPMIVSVAGIEPRQQIRKFLSDRGYRELRDFVCAA